VVSAESGQPTVKSQNEARREQVELGVRADPLVQAVLQKFPGAAIVEVRAKESMLEPPPASGDPELPDTSEMPPYDDEDR